MGAIEGKGLGDPKRMPAKSKKAGVELPETLGQRAKDAAALDAMARRLPLGPPRALRVGDFVQVLEAPVSPEVIGKIGEVVYFDGCGPVVTIRERNTNPTDAKPWGITCQDYAFLPHMVRRVPGVKR